MITQNFKQGNNEIKIEIAESLEDAEKNKFPKDIYSKYYINNKKIENYNAMIRFIVDESKKNKAMLVPSNNDLIKQRENMFKRQNEEISNRLQGLKETYSGMNIPEKILNEINKNIDKLDPLTGMRIKQ